MIKPEQNMTDEELVKGCCENNALAQRSLFDKFKGKMMSVCLRYADDRDEADDILQMGFIKVFEKINTFKSEGSLEGWVRRVMVNTALENYRKNKARKQDVDIENVHYMLKSESKTSDALDVKDLMKMIQQMPTGFRTVFNLFAIEGYSHKEIADQLGISEGTSKSQYARARAYLMDVIKTDNIISINTDQ